MAAEPGVGPERSTRDRILDAACDLIAKEGIDDVRIARVATRARASTALVHHYFSTREELLREALLHSFELAAAERFGEDPARAPTSAHERLASLIDECLPRPGRQEQEWVLWVELWLRAVREPQLRPIAAQLYERYREWVAAAIAAGVDGGEFADCDPDRLADHAIALLDGFGLRALLGDPAMPLERVPRLVAEDLAPRLGLDPDDLVSREP